MLAPITGTTTKTTKAKPVKVFKALDWQIPAWNDKSPTILLTGAAGGGKSHIALEKINGYCLKYPGAFALLIRKVKVSMTSGAALFFEDEVAVSRAESIFTGARHVASKSRFEYANGSMVVYVGLEDKKQLQRLKSIGRQGGVDIAFMEEATEFNESDFNAVLARMRGRAAHWRQIILACNPDAPGHWIYTRLIQGREAKVYYSAAKENTHNPADYLDTLNKLTGVDRQRLLEGKWVQATGLIYDVWLDDYGYGDTGNVSLEAEYRPDEGEIVWGVDDGYVGKVDPTTGYYTADSHPRAFGLFQLRPNGQLCLFDEHLAIRTQTDVHIQEVLELGYPLPEYAVVDKSAAQLIGRLNEMGIFTKKSASSVEESIKEMRRWLAPDSNGFRQLLVHPRCKHFRWEMVNYRYGDTNKPIKEYDHLLDLCRYLCFRLRYTSMED